MVKSLSLELTSVLNARFDHLERAGAVTPPAADGDRLRARDGLSLVGVVLDETKAPTRLEHEGVRVGPHGVQR